MASVVKVQRERARRARDEARRLALPPAWDWVMVLRDVYEVGDCLIMGMVCELYIPAWGGIGGL